MPIYKVLMDEARWGAVFKWPMAVLLTCYFIYQEDFLLVAVFGSMGCKPLLHDN